jgi:hypothetical protein
MITRGGIDGAPAGTQMNDEGRVNDSLRSIYAYGLKSIEFLNFLLQLGGD